MTGFPNYKQYYMGSDEFPVAILAMVYFLLWNEEAEE